MNTDFRLFQGSRERVSALVLAATATLLVFAAIHAGFTPQGNNLGQRDLAPKALSL